MEARSRARGVGFRILAVIVLLATLLPAATAVMEFGDPAKGLHRVHNITLGVLYLLGAGVPLFLALRSGARSVVSFRLFLAIVAATTIGALLSGDLVSGAYFILPLLALLVLALHPERGELLRGGRPDLAQVVLSIVALVLAFGWASGQADLQRLGDPAINPHVELHHYSSMAIVALSFGFAGLAVAFAGTGKRTAERLVAAMAVLLGLTSLVLPNYEGTWRTLGAASAIAFGLAYAALGLRAEWSAASAGAAE